MKWIHPQNMETRTVKVFALFPILYKGMWHWLEWVEKKQEYNAWHHEWRDR